MAEFERTKSNIDRLQQIQDGFCEALSVFAFCVDGEGHTLTHLSGDKNVARELMLKMPNDRLTLMLEYVMRSAVEDRLVEESADMEAYIGTLSVKVNKKPVFSFIVFAKSSDHTEDSVYKCLQLLYSTSKAIYDTSDEGTRELKAIKNLTNEIKLLTRKNQVMQEIIRLLDSDDGIENITDDILRRTCETLNISNAVLVRQNIDRGDYDVVGSYDVPDIERLLAGRRNIIVPDFFRNVDSNVSISSSTKVSESTKQDMFKYSIQAAVLTPVSIREKNSMTAIFLERRHEREWSIDDVRFINDVTRVLQNIINRRIQKNSLASSYQSLEKILNHVGSAIFVKDEYTKEVLYTNGILRQYFERELRDGTLGVFLDSALKNSDGLGCEIYYEESQKWFDAHCVKIGWVDGREVLMYALYDITDKKHYQNKIESQAKKDFLTGLYNRMSCENDLRDYIEMCSVNHTVGYIIYLDIDNFKSINDTLGHKYGDVLLQGVAHNMQRIKGLSEHCYRMGGDEFIIIVPPSIADSLEDILDELEFMCAKPWYLKGKDIYCTMSIGVAAFPDDADTLDELVKKADMAMYYAKKNGKNRTVRYDAATCKDIKVEE